MDAALEFYTGKLGFTVVEDSIVRGPLAQSASSGLCDAMRLVLLRVSRIGAMIELLEFQDDAGPIAQRRSFSRLGGGISILVPDTENYVKEMRRKGLNPASEMFSIMTKQGRCRVVFYEDPDGNRLEMIQVSAPDTSDR